VQSYVPSDENQEKKIKIQNANTQYRWNFGWRIRESMERIGAARTANDNNTKQAALKGHQKIIYPRFVRRR
jgi:hypothetical protein